MRTADQLKENPYQSSTVPRSEEPIASGKKFHLVIYVLEFVFFVSFFYLLAYAFGNERDDMAMSYFVVALGTAGVVCSGVGLVLGLKNRSIIASLYSAILLLILLGMLAMLLAPLANT